MAQRTRSKQARGNQRAKGRHQDRSASGRVTPKASSRYTPPVPKSVKVSPRWVPVLMFALLIVGVLMIVINYMGILPGGASNWYLLGGLVLITGGFITATRYR